MARIGQGAMGDVFKAHDAILDRHVALKTITASLESSPDARLRFHREAQSIARLNHPNIVTVYDFGEEEGEVYMAMEFLEGADLRNLIAEKRLTTLDDKLALMEQVCEGVGFAHSMSVVHRDLKPANIQVLTDGRVKVMDFGLARIGAASGMTQTGTVLGTPHYMSPEQVKGQKADPRSDVFALGAILYEVLTGHQPFEAESMHAVLFKILESEPEPVRRWYPEAPGPIVALAAKALSKDPEQRFANGARMAAVVRAVRAELSGDGSKPPGSLVTLLAAEESDVTHAIPAAPAATRGNLALEALVASDVEGLEPLETRQGEPTLSGKAPTRPGSASGRRSAPAAEAPSGGGRGWPLVAAGLVVVVGAGLVAWGMLRPGDEAPSTAAVATGSPAGQTDLGRQLLAAERKLAQEALQDREYEEAVDHADRALGVQPDDAEALRVREAARQAQDSAGAAATAARTALEQGDTTTAARRLEELLEIQPGHPAVAELKTGLDAIAAPSAPPPARAAAAPAKKPAAAAPAPAEAPPQPKPRPIPPPKQSAPPVRAPVSSPAAAPAPVSAAPPAATSAPPRAPTATASVPPSPATAPPDPAPEPPRGPSDDAQIRELVGNYGRAIATKDLSLFRQVKPNLSSGEEQRLRQAFEVGEQDVNIHISAVEVTGDSGRVRLVRRDTIGGKAIKPFEQVLSLRRGPRGWAIESIGR